jgi:Protein of unknown function (DUF1571)
MFARCRILSIVGWIALGFLLSGCAEFGQRRFGRRDEGPPSPAPTLNIPGPPTATAAAPAQEIKQATFQPPPGPNKPPVVAAQGEAPTNQILRALYQKANLRHQTMDSYAMRLRRRELVGSKARPEEVILVKFRQEPFSVYFKWIGPEAKGREVVYVKGRYGNEIHTLTAAGDILLLPAGARFSISADSSLVKSKSRYPITEAGLGSSIRKFGSLVEAVEKGDSRQGTLKYLGQVKRPEFEELVECVEQTVPPQSDPLLAGGGRRWWHFDTTHGLPVLVITHDETGREVEYYCNDRIQTPLRLDDDDFNPDKLWKKAEK